MGYFDGCVDYCNSCLIGTAKSKICIDYKWLTNVLLWGHNKTYAAVIALAMVGFGRIEPKLYIQAIIFSKYS